MTALHFLAGLPALLAITGFVLYQMLRRSAGADPVSLAIIAKLRPIAPERFAGQMSQLSPSSLKKVIESDQRLQTRMTESDNKLLERTLKQQHVQARDLM